MDELGIRAEARSIRDLLEPGRTFRIPAYQRSYSWHESDAVALVNDLIDAYDDARSHFLGAIVTVETNIKFHFEIADGQQRLTTLSMIMACLRDNILDRSVSEQIHTALCDDVTVGGWRLTLNHVDAPFFRNLLQRRGATAFADALTSEIQSHQLLRDNLLAIRELILTLSQRDRLGLSQFVADRCPIVHVQVESRDVGYKVFQVLNTRGRQPSAHDILKTELFERAKLTSEEADLVARAWTNYEARLGAKDFDDLLRQIRSLHDRQMRGDFVTGFCQSVLAVIPPRDFLQVQLPRHVDAFLELRSGQINLSREMPAVNAHLARLRSLEHTGWRAPALQFLVMHDRDADAAREFFCDLERLAFTLQLVITDREVRARRYRRVADDVVSDHQLFASDGALSLSLEEREKFSQRLLGRFGSVSQRRALALKLNSLFPDGESLESDSDATVEHILPRNPGDSSDWVQIWPDLAERRELCDTLGNFCLLAKSDNQKADRLDFLAKRDQIFRQTGGSGSFALTRDAARYEKWTPEIVKARTSRLCDLLIQDWKLDLPIG